MPQVKFRLVPLIGMALLVVGIWGWKRSKLSPPPSPTADEQRSSPSAFLEEFHAVRRSLKEDLTFPKVAILDSGLDQALAEQEGYSVPWDWAGKASLASEAKGIGLWDDLYHGTGLFLELGARDNNFGLVGLIPEAPLFPVRLGNREEFLSGKIPFSRIKAGFEMVARERVRIVAFSLSHLESVWSKADMESLLFRYRDQLLVVAAAGNDGRELSPGKDCPYVPICLVAPNLIKVGAVDYYKSNRGRVVDVRVHSESRQWRISASGNPEIVTLKSTSVAVPKVTAAAALLFALRPEASPAEVAEALRSPAIGESGIFPLKEIVSAWRRGASVRPKIE